jgi:hypothetical protein
MKDNAHSRKITFSQPEDRRKKGRSELRWLDSALKDLQTLKVTNSMVEDGTGQSSVEQIIKEGKAHKGL